MTESDELAALRGELATLRQQLIEQRVTGHGEGQEHAIADVNAGLVDDLIAPRLAEAEAALADLRQQVATLTQERDWLRADVTKIDNEREDAVDAIEVLRRQNTQHAERRCGLMGYMQQTFGFDHVGDDADDATSIAEAFLKQLVGERDALVQQWRPIETAPKDADAMLLYRDGEGVQPGYWSDEYGWLAMETQGLTGGRMQPTHWMPLPKPPNGLATLTPPPAHKESE